jgi:iron complex transport system permease protein
MLFGATLAVAAAGVCGHALTGTALPPGRAWEVLLGSGGTPSERRIVRDIRLPRALTGFLVGALLGMSGATFQGLFRNPLADPFVVGSSGGAALGGVVAFVLGAAGTAWEGIPIMGITAFAGACAATWAAFLLARHRGRVPLSPLLLIGFALGSFCSAVVTVLLLRFTRNWNYVLNWLMGHLAESTWAHVRTAGLASVAAFVVLAAAGRDLNAMAFGEETALQLGVETERLKAWILAAGSLAVGAAVAVAGIIGFVGLIVPHFFRRLSGPDHRTLIPLSALGGGAFLVFADWAARAALPPTGLPAGTITALLGLPFFVWVLRHSVRS